MICSWRSMYFSYCIFFFNDTATTEIYTLSLHDALPIFESKRPDHRAAARDLLDRVMLKTGGAIRVGITGVDRKSTRLNSSHANISYAVFCLKKKKKSYILTQY